MSSSVYSLAALKKSALHFLTGKACSAALTFCLLLLLVRVLPLQDYGVFVLLHSVIELMIPLSAFGMPWVVARFVPEYRLNASGDRLYRYIRNLLLIRFGILLLILLILYFAVDAYIDYANLESYQQVVRIFVWLFFIEAMDRLVRNELLGALLMQGVAQISLVIRNLLFLIGVLFFSVGEVALTEVVIVEVVASVLGLGISICGLILSLSRLRLQQGTTDWESPKISEMFSLGKKMYLTSLVTFCYKPQALLILIQQFVSLETLAVLGFLRSLYGQIDRYLPVKLLFSIIRPKLVVSYINEGGISTLTQQANLAGKLSMFVLMPIIVLVGVSGEEIIQVLSGDKFTDTGHLFVLFMFALIPVSQQQILEMVAVTTGHSSLCFYASLMGLLVIPFSLFLLYLELEVYVIPLSLIVSTLIYNLVVVTGIIKKTEYRVDVIGFGKLFCASILLFILMKLVLSTYASIYEIALNFVFIAIAYLIFCFFVRVFSKQELSKIKKIIK